MTELPTENYLPPFPAIPSYPIYARTASACSLFNKKRKLENKIINENPTTQIKTLKFQFSFK